MYIVKPKSVAKLPGLILEEREKGRVRLHTRARGTGASMHTHAGTRTHTRTHARTHAYTPPAPHNRDIKRLHVIAQEQDVGQGVQR